MATHSAAGIAFGFSQEASRLLRAAEGLIRAASAVLDAAGGASVKSPAGTAAAAAGGLVGPTGKRRRRNKKKKKEVALGESAKPDVNMGGGAGSVEQWVHSDGSVLFGDLSELGSACAAGSSGGAAASVHPTAAARATPMEIQAAGAIVPSSEAATGRGTARQKWASGELGKLQGMSTPDLRRMTGFVSLDGRGSRRVLLDRLTGYFQEMAADSLMA